MKGSKKVYIVLVLVLSSMALTGQVLDGLEYYKPKQLKKLINNAELIGDVYTAISLYERYVELKPDDLGMHMKLAGACEKSRNYPLAARYYKSLYEKAPDDEQIALFHYARMVMMQGQYKHALESFKLFRDNKGRTRYDSRWYKNLVEGCEDALEEMETNPGGVAEVFHLDTSINKANIDYSPFFVNDSFMVYSSLRKEQQEFFPTGEGEIDIPVRGFYTAVKTSDTTWLFDGQWLDIFNSNIAHTGNGALSIDRKRFYYTRCHPLWDNSVECEIMVSHKIDGEWTKPARLNDDINMPGYVNTMPALGVESRRGKEVLYFVSNRPRGRGGLDIYYTVFDDRDSTYSNVRSCGSRINSEGDDITPYYDVATRHLYFSTDYEPGHGGFDVFKARGEQGRFIRPKNLGMPVNSPADDIYFVVNPNDKLEGFLVSNRPGSVALVHPTCCDDIFYYNLKNVITLTITGRIFESEPKPDSMLFKSDAIISLLNDTVQNQDIMMIDSSITEIFSNRDKKDDKQTSERILDGAMAVVYLVDPEQEELIYIATDTVDQDGKYYVDLDPGEKYKIVFKRDEYFNKNLEVSTEKYFESDSIFVEDVYLDRIPRDPITFNIYYDFDKANLKEESKEMIDSTLLEVLVQTPELIVEISSHTDNTGDSLYNRNLSQRRAESVVNYLAEQGISKRRLIAIGYGEDRPIADNTTLEGQAMNRRTEFKVIGSIDQFSKLNVTDLEIRKIKPRN